MDRYNAEYQKWLDANWEKFQRNKELVKLGYPPQPIPPPPHRPGEIDPLVKYARPVEPDYAGPKDATPTPPDRFPGHTISQAGADAHESYAKGLPRDTYPRQTARMLKSAIDEYGDQGRADFADLLGRFHKVDSSKAEALRKLLNDDHGEDLPFRVAPLG